MAEPIEVPFGLWAHMVSNYLDHLYMMHVSYSPFSALTLLVWQ